MMAVGHAATGAAGAALLALVPGISINIFTLPIIMLVGAGAALWPDMDHTKATAATTWGPISYGFAWLLENFSQFVYVTTRRGKDMRRHGGHRTLTHTILFAVVSGALVFLTAGNNYINLIVLFIMLCLGLRGLFPKTTAKNGKFALYGFAAMIPLAMYMGKVPYLDPLTLGIVIMVGSAIHSLGDCLTDSGAPLLFPIPLHGQLWYRFRTEWLSFSTGSKRGKEIEKWIKRVCVLIIIGVSVIRLGYEF